MAPMFYLIKCIKMANMTHHRSRFYLDTVLFYYRFFIFLCEIYSIPYVINKNTLIEKTINNYTYVVQLKKKILSVTLPFLCYLNN